MSLRYKGAVVSATPPTVSATSPTPYGTATGVWTLQQQLQYQGAGTWPSPYTPPYIEDVFSTYLYTGNGSTQTITNNIDLSGKGGLVWMKCRTFPQDNMLIDTVRGGDKRLTSNGTNASFTSAQYITSFSTTGFSIGNDNDVNSNGQTFASWTFRKQAKFFDVVTFTGTGSAQQINHNLGSTPGCIIVKNTSAAQAWYVYHRSLSTPANDYLILNTTAASAAISGLWGTVNSTQFGFLGNNGENYVAYLFAHDAGGFGTSGTDNVISCGSYTGNGSATGPTITLGYEPQWILVKRTTTAGAYWYLMDVMRGMGYNGAYELYPNLTAVDTAQTKNIVPTATGFQVVTTDGYLNSNGGTFIYIAIRRGPMKTPTNSTNVFTPVVRTGTNSDTSYTGLSFSPDLVIGKARNSTYSPAPTYTTKLIGVKAQLGSSATTAESTATDAITGWLNTGYNLGADNSLGNYNLDTTSNGYVSWNFGRAPGFFDVVCYKGTGSATTFSHNLGVAPELMIVKDRSVAGNWYVYAASVGAGKYLSVNLSNASTTSTTIWNNTNPTSSVFSVGTTSGTNANAENYVAYLFATVTGVSKVGSYTGTGTTKQIDCGFTNGSRFVLIKRTDLSGSWLVWDSARGIVAGNDPYLLLNSTAVEVTNTDYVDTYSAGFELSSTAPADINANGGTYIFLAIA